MKPIAPFALRVWFRFMAWRRFFRGKTWSLKGAAIGKRVSVDRNCRVDRPWNVVIGDRVTLESDVWLKLVADGATVKIGTSTFLGRGCELDVMGDLVIGCHTLIAPGCFITDHNHGTKADRRFDQQDCDVRPISIGSNVWIGARVCLLPGVRIGDGAIVGAGAVVVNDVPSMSIVAGVPAKIVRYREHDP